MQLVESKPNSLPKRPSAGIETFSPPCKLGGVRPTLIYALHSSEMYGTERMALATAQGLADDFDFIFIGPRGPALQAAADLGFETRFFQTIPQLMKLLIALLHQFDSFVFVSTLPRYSAICIALNMVFRRHIRNIQMIHGGGDEQKDFAGLRRFNGFDTSFITVSEYSRQRMIAHGVRPERIAVVGNFLTPAQLDSMPRRAAYERDGVRSVAVVSRVDRPKRVDLLLDSLDLRGSELRDLDFRIYGWGPDLDHLRARAAQRHPNVQFVGYVDNVAARLVKADLLLHTCPVEAFGLAVLEAMELNLACLVPDQGGTASLIADGQSGFTFRANDAAHLAGRLVELKSAPAALLNCIALAARESCETRFSGEASINQYRRLFAPTNV
jgi:glycosyltransferase involved in cell wall biosynthesis